MTPRLDGARKTQFYSMLGSRGIWHDGWKAVTTHPHGRRMEQLQRRHLGAVPHRRRPLRAPRSVQGELGQAQGTPEPVVRGGRQERRVPARRPLSPRDHPDAAALLAPPRDRYTYFPDTADVPEAQAVNVRNRSYAIGALVDIPAPGAEGVLFAHGARFGGHALYVKDDRLHYVNSFVGMFEQKIDASEDLPTGENLILSASFDKDGEDAPGVATGILFLYYGEKKVGEGRIKTQPGAFSLAGEGLCVGRDSGEAVTDDYPGVSPHRFTGGTIKRVAVDVSGEPYVDLEREAQAMLCGSDQTGGQ